MHTFNLRMLKVETAGQFDMGSLVSLTGVEAASDTQVLLMEIRDSLHRIEKIAMGKAKATQ